MREGLLPTRSDQDLQLRAHLRWVASSDFGIEAENIETKQLLDKLNPYVKIKCSGGSQGDFERMTKVVNATEKHCCDWNEIFDFLITEEGTTGVEPGTYLAPVSLTLTRTSCSKRGLLWTDRSKRTKKFL